MNKKLVVIRGGGDLATGVAVRLFCAGLKIVILEIERPTVIRLPVSFAGAVYEGKVIVEGIEAVLTSSWEKAEDIIKKGKIPVLVDPQGNCIEKLAPVILVDAILAKRNLGTKIDQAPLVIGLGPGFTAGEDVDVVIETERGHNLGRVLYQGHKIGDLVKEGEVIAEVEGIPLKAEISGVLRGLIYPQSWVTRGMKIGDIDPRVIREYCFTVSDKARSLGGAVLEAICTYLNKR
jgi:xanthine dehydrogenase accessory factor